MNKNIKEFAESKPAFAYSIFCGVLKTNFDGQDNIIEVNNFQEWQTHVFQDNKENNCNDENSLKRTNTLINEMGDVYYPSFINCLFPGNSSLNQVSDIVKGYTKPLGIKYFVNDTYVLVKYIDLFLFPENLLIYCFKCEFIDQTLDEIINLIGFIRELNCEKIDFLFPLIKSFTTDSCFRRGNKFKHFTVIEHNLSFDTDYSSDHLLYDLGTCSPLGSSIGAGHIPSLKPSDDYFKLIIDRNKISVFENWSALSLFDSFVVLHKGTIYNYNWEFPYFRLLFIHSLFIKYYLIEISKEFLMEQNCKTLENDFHEFNKHFNLKQISYNFLPQIIYERIRSGFNIENELTEIRHSIERDHKRRQEKRQLEESASEKRINIALFIVAILTVFTAVKDGSDWLSEVFSVKHGALFNLLTVSSLLIVYTTVLYFLFRKR